MPLLKRYQPHYKALVHLGLPLVVGQIGMIIQGFADTLMIGHHSTAELSAAGFVNNIFILAIVFCTGFSYGLTPIISNLYGAGNQQSKIGGMLRHSFYANMVVGVLILSLLCILYGFIDKLGQPEELLPLMRPYYLSLLFSIPVVLIFYSFKQFVDGITDTRISMWIIILGNVLNIVGNFILIYGLLGVPEFGLLDTTVCFSEHVADITST